jgi:hypothetical protein
MLTRSVASSTCAIRVLGGALVAIVALARPTAASPLPDPPAFGLVNLAPGQSIRINVVCAPHGIGRVPPGPCAGQLMFHDGDGNMLSSQTVSLTAGKSASLAFDGAVRGGTVAIDPCWIPAPDSSRGIPSVEVFDTASGQTTMFINPAVARLSNLAAARGK